MLEADDSRVRNERGVPPDTASVTFDHFFTAFLHLHDDVNKCLINAGRCSVISGPLNVSPVVQAEKMNWKKRSS